MGSPRRAASPPLVVLGPAPTGSDPAVARGSASTAEAVWPYNRGMDKSITNVSQARAAYLLLSGEPVTSWQLAGTAPVIAGIYLLSKSKK